MNDVLWQDVSIAFSKVAATKNFSPFCILYGSSQSCVRRVLFILDTNWTQRFGVNPSVETALVTQALNVNPARISIAYAPYPLAPHLRLSHATSRRLVARCR